MAKSYLDYDNQTVFLSNALSITSQSLINALTDYKWPSDQFLLDYSELIPDFLKNKSIIPHTLLDSDTENLLDKLEIFRDYIRLGFITIHINNPDVNPHKVDTLFKIKSQLFFFECSYHERVTLAISCIKIEIFLLAFLNQDINLLNLSFALYRNCNNDYDIKSREQIEILLKLFGTECQWEDISVMVHRLLKHSRKSLNTIVNVIIKDFLIINRDSLITAFQYYFKYFNGSIINMNEKFWKEALLCLHDPMNNSGLLDPSSDPDKQLIRMRTDIEFILKNNTNGINKIGKESRNSTPLKENIYKALQYMNNFLLSHKLLPMSSLEEASELIAKFSSNCDPQAYNTSDDEFDDQSIYIGLVQLILSLTATPSDGISLLRLIITGMHPLISS